MSRTISTILLLYLLFTLFDSNALAEGILVYVPSSSDSAIEAPELQRIKERFPHCSVAHLFSLFGRPRISPTNLSIKLLISRIRESDMVNMRYDDALSKVDSIIESLEFISELVYPELLFEIYILKSLIMKSMGDERYRSTIELAISVMETGEIDPTHYPPSFIKDFKATKERFLKKGRVRLILPQKAGVQIYVDGVSVSTDSALLLSGDHLVQFVREGYPIYARMVYLEEGTPEAFISDEFGEENLWRVSSILKKNLNIDGIGYLSPFFDDFTSLRGLEWIAFTDGIGEEVIVKERGKAPNLLSSDDFSSFCLGSRVISIDEKMDEKSREGSEHPYIEFFGKTSLSYLYLAETHYSGLSQELGIGIRRFLFSLSAGILFDILNIGKPDLVHRYGETYLYFILPVEVGIFHSTRIDSNLLFYGAGLQSSIPCYRGPSGGPYEFFFPFQGVAKIGLDLPFPSDILEGEVATSFGYGTEGVSAVFTMGIKY